jgi:hypothetical protein
MEPTANITLTADQLSKITFLMKEEIERREKAHLRYEEICQKLYADPQQREEKIAFSKKWLEQHQSAYEALKSATWNWD